MWGGAGESPEGERQWAAGTEAGGGGGGVDTRDAALLEGGVETWASKSAVSLRSGSQSAGWSGGKRSRGSGSAGRTPPEHLGRSAGMLTPELVDRRAEHNGTLTVLRSRCSKLQVSQGQLKETVDRWKAHCAELSEARDSLAVENEQLVREIEAASRDRQAGTGEQSSDVLDEVSVFHFMERRVVTTLANTTGNKTLVGMKEFLQEHPGTSSFRYSPFALLLFAIIAAFVLVVAWLFMSYTAWRIFGQRASARSYYPRISVQSCS